MLFLENKKWSDLWGIGDENNHQLDKNKGLTKLGLLTLISWNHFTGLFLQLYLFPA